MEREKLIWAGFGIVSLMSFVYFHSPLPRTPSSRERRASRSRSRAEGGTGAKPSQPHTPTPMRRMNGVDRSRGSVASKREKCSSQVKGSNNNARARYSEGSSPLPHAPHVNGAAVVTELTGKSTTGTERSDGQPTSKCIVNAQRLTGTVVAPPKSRNNPHALERATQTDGCILEELRRPTQTWSGPGDDLGWISPIPSRDKDLASPLSSAGLFLSPMQPSRGGGNPLLPPALERGVEVELRQLVAEVQQSPASPKAWLNLYNFLTKLPKSVLHFVVVKKNDVDLPSLPLTATSLPANGIGYFGLLQQEVRRLVRGEVRHGARGGRFTITDSESAIVWCPRKGSRFGKSGRFAHISLQSSDEDEEVDREKGGEEHKNNNDEDHGGDLIADHDGEVVVDDDDDDGVGSGVGGREEEEDKIKVAERVEKILLARRREKMRSAATQFPDGSIPETAEKQQQQSYPALFEEESVMKLLNSLVKLRQHAAFGVLQRGAIDASFSLDIADVINDAQRLLDRAVVRMATRVATPETQMPPQETHQTSSEVRFTSDEKHMRPKQQRHEPEQRQRQQQQQEGGMDSVPSENHVAGNINTRNSDESEEDKNLTAPQSSETPEAFARLLTTSTIPSAPLDESERQKKSFGRSQTQFAIESISGQNSMTSVSFGVQQRLGVYDRLYTPPKTVPRPSPQPNAPVSGRSKAPFNVYV